MISYSKKKTSFARIVDSKHKIIILSSTIFLIFTLFILLTNTATADGETQKLDIVDPSDSYDYVVITDENLKDSFDNLIDWKTKKGVKSISVTVESIDGNYTGIDTQEKIRNFIIDAYFDWGITYVLLGGDSNVVPYRGVYGIVNKGLSGEEEDFDMPCDMYYSNLDGNWDDDGDGIYGEGSSADGGTGTAGEEADLEAEIYIGRAPVDTIAEVVNFVNKVIFYERTPITDYLENGLFCASKLDDVTDGAVTSDNIINNKIPGDFAITTLYENDASANNSEMTIQINNGQNIVNIIGHGSPTSLGLAHEDYTDTFDSSDVDILLNGFRYFLIYSVGCDSNSYDLDSISEHFINNIGNGAFAYLGNSRYGWYERGQPGVGASEKLNVEFFDALYTENIQTLGKAFQDSKEDLISDVDAIEAMRWCYFSLTLLGDPETPIWTDSPKILDVSYKSTIYDVQQSYEIYVNDSGVPVENAKICIIQSPGIYEVQTTDINGVAVFDIKPIDGLMDITVSKGNFDVYENIINIVEMDPPDVEVITPISLEYHCNLSIDWIATDNGTVDEIRIEYKFEDGDWQKIIEGLTNFDAPWEWNLLTPYMENGNYTIKVIAIDNEGNFGENYSEEFIIYNPEIKIVVPNGANILDDIVNIIWTVTDYYDDIDDLEIWNTSDGGDNYTLLDSGLSKYPTQWQWDTKTVEDGEYHKIKIIANIGTVQIEVTTENLTVYNPDPPIPIIIVDKTEVWEDEKIFFDASDSDDPDENFELSYFWDFDDGTQKKGVSLMYSFENMGIYNVTLTVKDETSLTNETWIIIQVNNSPPKAVIKVNKTEWNEDDSIFFDGSGSIDNSSDKLTLVYHWDFGDNMYGVGEKVTHAFSDEGIYFVKLSVIDDDNYENSNVSTITIMNLMPIADAGSYQRANKFEQINFDGSKSTDTPSDKKELEYYWDFGDGNQENGINFIHPYHDYKISDRYFVTLTVIDNNGESDISRIVVDINNETITAQISKIDGMDIAIGNENQEIVFDASNSTKPEDANIDYYWDFGDGNIGFGKIVRHKFLMGTDNNPFNVKLLIQDNDTTNESDADYKDEINIWVNWAPDANISANIYKVIVNESIVFSANLSTDKNEYGDSGNIVKYIWDFGDGSTGNKSSMTHKYSKSGNYTVKLTVIDDKGVESSTTEIIRVREKDIVEDNDEDNTSILDSVFNEYIIYWIFILVGAAILLILGIMYQKKIKELNFRGNG